MTDLVRQKFQDPELRAALLATGNRYLEETNWWGDTFWGVCNGAGENRLGMILMAIRTRIIMQSESGSEETDSEGEGRGRLS